MLVPFDKLSEPRRTRLMCGLLAVAAVGGFVLVGIPPQAQPCVLYGIKEMPAGDWYFALLGLVGVSSTFQTTWDCLSSVKARELGLVLVDDTFALGYGGGLGLLFSLLASFTHRRPYMPELVANLLRFVASCYPIAAAFDLIENQLIAVLLFVRVPDDPNVSTWNLLILIARWCAIPKYDLSFVVGPTLALLALAIALVSWLRR